MRLHFYKYEGAGNDFIIVDNRSQNIVLGEKNIKHLCSNHFGIGSDGLMILTNDTMSDFNMQFFNPDGSSGMMCGNGGRCIVRFAKDIGVIDNNKTTFTAPDGVHSAEILEDNQVALKMIDVQQVQQFSDGYWLDTGTSHFVVKVDNVRDTDVIHRGRTLRYDDRFIEHKGTNVNFYSETEENTLLIRTYERGVENETLACGTGITATALAYSIYKNYEDGNYTIDVHTLNNNLKVLFTKKQSSFYNIVLQGPANKVFEGDIEIQL
ncbi:MAG: diaminopimelate epimerase [Bacteroidales bacterium]|nr:diaminopimelate epimerase [Bacteroidales bacterium]MBQ9255411.1 diaminopimelate epimerase [Bacteroidales bacterium]